MWSKLITIENDADFVNCMGGSKHVFLKHQLNEASDRIWPVENRISAKIPS